MSTRVGPGVSCDHRLPAPGRDGACFCPSTPARAADPDRSDHPTAQRQHAGQRNRSRHSRRWRPGFAPNHALAELDWVAASLHYNLRGCRTEGISAKFCMSRTKANGSWTSTRSRIASISLTPPAGCQAREPKAGELERFSFCSRIRPFGVRKQSSAAWSAGTGGRVELASPQITPSPLKAGFSLAPSL